MAEVLGAVAAAAQLTATCLALIELTKRINSRTSTLENYQKQLLQLQHISESISSNPLLQTPEIELHTRNIISLLSDRSLEPSLKRNRISQIILFFSQDRTISRLFIDLEKHKATLSLVINEVQSRALHQIQNSISTMSDRQANTKKKATRGGPVAMDDTTSRSQSRRPRTPPSQQDSSSPDLFDGTAVPLRPQPQGAGPRGEGEPSLASIQSDTAPQSPDGPGIRNPAFLERQLQHLDLAGKCLSMLRQACPGQLPELSFTGCSSFGVGSHVNGTRIESNCGIDPETTDPLIDETTLFIACTSDNDDHINGTDVVITGGIGSKTRPPCPKPRGQYIACGPLLGGRNKVDVGTVLIEGGEAVKRKILVNGVSIRSLGSEEGPSGSEKTRE